MHDAQCNFKVIMAHSMLQLCQVYMLAEFAEMMLRYVITH